jgi:uncharacterized membrane protein
LTAVATKVAGLLAQMLPVWFTMLTLGTTAAFTTKVLLTLAVPPAVLTTRVAVWVPAVAKLMLGLARVLVLGLPLEKVQE